MNLPFAQKEVIIGNPESRIGVCTLWSPREKFIHKYLNNGLMDKIALVGNLYSVFGVGILIRNYLANPQLRYLIVCGTELGFAKTALENLGIDNLLPEKLFLGRNHIVRFLEQVKIIYTKDISSVIQRKDFQELNLENKHFEPLIIPLPDPRADVFPASDSGHLIRTNTIVEGYYALLKEIRFFGHITGQDSEGHRRQELWELNMVITSQDSCDFDSIPHPEYDKAQIQKYCEDFWNGTEPADLAYRYGHIIRYGFGDQVEAAIKAFKDKAETFRTVISLWNPNIEGGSITATDPPCICTIHPRIIGEYLHQWAYIRTNDMFSGWPLNAAALRYFQFQLLERLRIELNRFDLKLGELGITSGSAHLYERDWVRVDAMLKGKRNNRFQSDPKGNFEVSIENDEIIVRHFSPDGTLLQIFRNESADKLSVDIAPFISQIQHAFYLGAELRKAEERLLRWNPFR